MRRHEVWAKATFIQQQFAERGQPCSRTKALKLATPKRQPQKSKKSRNRLPKMNPAGFDKAALFNTPTQRERLDILRFWARVRVHNQIPPEVVRMQFIDSWATRPPPSRSKCFCCQAAKADCYHHAIQVQNGGDNEDRNLVPVCDPCHELIHPWIKNSAPTQARVGQQAPA